MAGSRKDGTDNDDDLNDDLDDDQLEDRYHESALSHSRSFVEVMKQNAFLYPALAGLGLVLLFFFIDSTYQWVLAFFYFLFGLPGLFLYAKHLPDTDDVLNGRLPIELESYEPLRTRLARSVSPTRADRILADDAFRQFGEAVKALQLAKTKNLPPRSRQQSEATFKYVMDNLAVSATVLRQLDGIDHQNVLRKIQDHEGRSNLNEKEQRDLKLAREQAKLREQLLSSLIDRLRANEASMRTIATGEAAGSAPPSSPKASRT